MSCSESKYCQLVGSGEVVVILGSFVLGMVLYPFLSRENVYDGFFPRVGNLVVALHNTSSYPGKTVRCLISL